MVRVPCCERMGMKKGPWTAEEDQILISYIRRCGHDNWRALPKQAGLLRCGKSCRLRWTNYLRPDIKRGNFTKEEEETIIEQHQMLGNRWSAIATKLPGRTDNEIKNYWHTHLKRRVEENPATASGKLRCSSLQTSIHGSNHQKLLPDQSWISNHPGNSQKNGYYNSHSAQSKHLGIFSTVDDSSSAAAMQCKQDQILQTNSSAQEFSLTSNKSLAALESRAQILSATGQSILQIAGDECKNNDMLFWYNLFVNAGKSQETQKTVA